MAKKNKQVAVSQGEQEQAQEQFAKYSQVAVSLRGTKDRAGVEEALAEINALAEGVQIALLKALAKERQAAAADVVLALHEVSPIKNVRKEARRALLQLESAKIMPQWRSPIEQVSALSAIQGQEQPPRFWKGFVTDSRSEGQIQMILAWEQGEEYRDVRLCGFLIDFWNEGLKDFFTAIETKSSYEKLRVKIQQDMQSVVVKECSLAEGKRNLLEALEISKRVGFTLNEEYRFNHALVERLILEAPGLEDVVVELEPESAYEPVDLRILKPPDVVVNFVELWAAGEYALAYELTSKESALRERLPKAEWIERRKAWAEVNKPTNLNAGFIVEHEKVPAQQTQLWLPNPFARKKQEQKYEEYEANWSLILSQPPTDNVLPELPAASTVYEDLERYWFWATYRLVQEDGAWRIQDIIDQGAHARMLPIEELKRKLHQYDSEADRLAKDIAATKVKKASREKLEASAEMVRANLMHAICYADVLIEHLPLDFLLHDQAAARSILTQEYPRALVYLKPLAERIAVDRESYYHRLASILSSLFAGALEDDNEELAERYMKLAKQAFTDSLALKASFEVEKQFVNLLLKAMDELSDEEDTNLSEAKVHALQASSLASDSLEEAQAEDLLGEIASLQNEDQEALKHYQRVLELQPDFPGSWYDLGKVHESLENFEEAEASYKRTLELDPGDIDAYAALANLYRVQDQGEKALHILEAGIAANPEEAIMYGLMSTQLMMRGDYEQAEIYLNRAEELDPEEPFIVLQRQVLATEKLKSTNPKFGRVVESAKPKGKDRYRIV